MDIWSIGVCLYVMLTGTLPFSSRSLTELHAMMLDGIYELPEGSSEPLCDLLRPVTTLSPSPLPSPQYPSPSFILIWEKYFVTSDAATIVSGWSSLGIFLLKIIWIAIFSFLFQLIYMLT